MGIVGRGAACACAASLALAAAAQDAWRIPPLGAVEYRREWRGAAAEPVRSGAAAKQAPCSGKLPDRYLHRLAPAPWVCRGELRADQRAVAGPVRDLRDVLRAIACDLGSRSGVRASRGCCRSAT